MKDKQTAAKQKEGTEGKLLVEKDREIARIAKELLLQKEEISNQKELIETQRDVALRQRDEILRQKKEITSSITYAQRIQSALLPKDELFKRYFADHFVLYKPKDIVSGDFYWLQEKDGKLVVVAADSTGHGVPGAFMSLMGFTYLNEIVEGMGIVQPNRILNLMREKIIKSLVHEDKQTELSDGMDISVVAIESKKMIMQYAGAFNPIYIIRNGELNELKADRMPLGYNQFNNEKPFTNQQVDISANDSIYMFSDGFVDQFGWRTDKKFMTRNFKSLLLEIQNVPMKAQKVLLENAFNNWKGDVEQLDDILVMGLQM
jgi:serine phosphatase RsbU (regulator of sigma subunit)